MGRLPLFVPLAQSPGEALRLCWPEGSEPEGGREEAGTGDSWREARRCLCAVHGGRESVFTPTKTSWSQFHPP